MKTANLNGNINKFFPLLLQLLSSDLKCNDIDDDDDDDHIFGFSLEKIRKEARRASRLVCKHIFLHRISMFMIVMCTFHLISYRIVHFASQAARALVAG